MNFRHNTKEQRVIDTREYLLPLVICDRTGLLFEGEVDAVSSVNDKGPFDVLPLHINFISIIHGAVELRYKGKIIKQIPIEKGVLAVREGRAEVYLGIKPLP